MDRGSQHCAGGNDQNHLKEKEMQEGKVAIDEGNLNGFLSNSHIEKILE